MKTKRKIPAAIVAMVLVMAATACTTIAPTSASDRVVTEKEGHHERAQESMRAERADRLVERVGRNR